MSEALYVLVGVDAKGLSPSVMSRLKGHWYEQYEAWHKRRLDKYGWVYVWADGIYSGLRAEGQRLCALVIRGIGVNDRGENYFLAIDDGVRELTQSWCEVFARAQGLAWSGHRSWPSAMVRWGSGRTWEEVFPKTRHQRCWVDKTVNVLDYLPKASRPRPRERFTRSGWHRPARRPQEAKKAFERIAEIYRVQIPQGGALHAHGPRRLAGLLRLSGRTLWVHLRTSDPIQSTFGTVRHRTDRAKVCVPRETMLAFIYKPGMCAEKRWQRIRGFNCLAKVIAGVKLKDGIEVEEPKNENRDAT